MATSWGPHPSIALDPHPVQPEQQRLALHPQQLAVRGCTLPLLLLAPSPLLMTEPAAECLPCQHVILADMLDGVVCRQQPVWTAVEDIAELCYATRDDIGSVRRRSESSIMTLEHPPQSTPAEAGLRCAMLEALGVELLSDGIQLCLLGCKCGRMALLSCRRCFHCSLHISIPHPRDMLLRQSGR